MCFCMNAPPEKTFKKKKKKKKEAVFVDGHTVNSAPTVHTQRPPTKLPERRLNGLSGDYTQINQSTVTLHHIGAVCDSERRSCNLRNVLHVPDRTAKGTM